MENTCKECATLLGKCDVCHDAYLCEMYHEYLAYQEMHNHLEREDNEEP